MQPDWDQGKSAGPSQNDRVRNVVDCRYEKVEPGAQFAGLVEETHTTWVVDASKFAIQVHETVVQSRIALRKSLWSTDDGRSILQNSLSRERQIRASTGRD